MAHVTFIHGIANKPAADVLTGIWERALADDDGIDLGAEGVTASMVYWADVLYPEPAGSSLESVGDQLAEGAADPGWDDGLDAADGTWVAALAERLETSEEDTVGAKVALYPARSPWASWPSARAASGAIGSKMPSSAWEKPCSSPAISSG